MATPEISLQYLAGLIDGEGCISTHFNRAYKYPRVVMQLSVANTRRDLLEKLKVQFGGCVHFVRKPKERENHKPSFSWTLSEQQAARMLEQVLPFLLIKEEQAKLLLQLAALKTLYRHNKAGRGWGNKLTDVERQERLDIATRCRELNKRGR